MRAKHATLYEVNQSMVIDTKNHRMFSNEELIEVNLQNVEELLEKFPYDKKYSLAKDLLSIKGVTSVVYLNGMTVTTASVPPGSITPKVKETIKENFPEIVFSEN